MKILKFAAIDIGSNAIRLLIMNVIEHKGKSHFKKSSLLRVPLGLGTDSFIHGHISEGKTEMLIKTMKAFRHLMDIHQAISYRACATSALREANNGMQIIQRIKQETGIFINIISGKEEARIIFSNHIAEEMDPNKYYLYVDVGGGSTDITLFANGKQHLSSSFNIGTLKILSNRVPPGEFIQLKEFLLDISTNGHQIEIIGSGGNINKILKYSPNNSQKQLTYHQLKGIYDRIKALSRENRMIKLDMNPDRADVIIPAATIFLSIMEWGGIHLIHVPKIGISDGIVHMLYKEYLRNPLLVV